MFQSHSASSNGSRKGIRKKSWISNWLPVDHKRFTFSNKKVYLLISSLAFLIVRRAGKKDGKGNEIFWPNILHLKLLPQVTPPVTPFSLKLVCIEQNIFTNLETPQKKILQIVLNFNRGRGYLMLFALGFMCTICVRYKKFTCGGRERVG